MFRQPVDPPAAISKESVLADADAACRSPGIVTKYRLLR
jgi:hypothetical protein